MGKVLKILALSVMLAVVGYVVLAAVVLWYMPKQLEKEEARMPAIQRAVAECAADQLLLSQRINEIIDKAQKNNSDKVTVVKSLLSDTDINRLALNYLGADFSTARSSFIGQIKHSYTLLEKQKSIYKTKDAKKDEWKKKLRDLESQKKYLLDAPNMRGGGDGRRDWTWNKKIEDIDSQIHLLREIELSEQLKGKDAKGDYAIEMAKLEKTVFSLCEQYEKNMIEKLVKTVTERKEVFQNDIRRIAMLRDTYDSLNIWPLPAMKRAFFDKGT